MPKSMKIISATSPFGEKPKAEPKFKTIRRTKERANDELVADFNAIIQGVDAAFAKTFPRGWCKTTSKKLIGKAVISVHGGIIGDVHELSGRILENDPAFFHFLIQKNGNNYEIEHMSGFGLCMKPEPGSHFAMQTMKVKLRKTSGTPDKIIDAFEKQMKKLKKVVQTNEAGVYNRESYSDKFFK